MVSGQQVNLNACGPHARQPTASDERVGVLQGHHHTGNSRFNERVAARGCAALVAARLQRDQGGGSLYIGTCRLRGTQRHDFGVWPTGLLCVPLEHAAIGQQQAAGDPGVGV